MKKKKLLQQIESAASLIPDSDETIILMQKFRLSELNNNLKDKVISKENASVEFNRIIRACRSQGVNINLS